MLSKIYKLALEKCNDYKSSAQNTTKLHNNIIYNFESIHNDILEHLSKIDKCSNFILTEQQFINAKKSNQNIIKPYVGFTNDKKECIDIREYITDKLKKYKIIGIKIGRYGKFEYHYPCANPRNYPNDNYFYILFININGETYGNIFLENRWKEKIDKPYQGLTFKSYDWYLELFIKPFAIYPEQCNTIAYKLSNNINTSNCFANSISHFHDNLYWSPYIDKNHYSCKDYCVDDKIIELYHEPKYKEYIETDKIIPSDIMINILNKSDFISELFKKKSYIKFEYVGDWNSHPVSNIYFSHNFGNIYDIFYIQYLEIEKEINKIKNLEKNIKINIFDNKLLITNYYKENLNLSEYIPLKVKKIIKDCNLIDIKYTDIDEIQISDSNIINIKLYSQNKDYKNIKIIGLRNCPKFKTIDCSLKTQLEEFYIDDKKIDIIQKSTIKEKRFNKRK